MCGKKCNIIVQFSTGGAVWHKPEERIECLDANPEMATLSAGSCNFGDDVFLNSPSFMELLATRMKERGIKPEIEVFEPGMIDNALRLVKKGLLEFASSFRFCIRSPRCDEWEHRRPRVFGEQTSKRMYMDSCRCW